MISMACVGIYFTFDSYNFNRKAVETTGIISGLPKQKAVPNDINAGKHTEWNIAYSFIVDGKNYTGEDTVRYPPRDQEVSVFYRFDNIDDNRLEKDKVGVWLVASILGFVGGIGTISTALITNKKERHHGHLRS